MVEASSKEVDEDVMLDALMFGHGAIKELCDFEQRIIDEVGLEKMEYETLEISSELTKEIKEEVSTKFDEAMRIKDKLEKYAAIEAIKDETVNKYITMNEDLKPDELDKLSTAVKLILANIEYEIFRQIVVKERTRADGREMTEIRSLSAMVDILPRTLGSALFTRGQTQALAVTTLGALGEHQILDGLGIEDAKILCYIIISLLFQ